jgi:hypothetical protein
MRRAPMLMYADLVVIKFVMLSVYMPGLVSRYIESTLISVKFMICYKFSPNLTYLRFHIACHYRKYLKILYIKCGVNC